MHSTTLAKSTPPPHPPPPPPPKRSPLIHQIVHVINIKIDDLDQSLGQQDEKWRFFRWKMILEGWPWVDLWPITSKSVDFSIVTTSTTWWTFMTIGLQLWPVGEWDRVKNYTQDETWTDLDETWWNCFNFGEYPDQASIIFEVVLHHWEIRQKAIYNMIF